MMIGEFAEKVGLTTDTLRYYEKIGLIPEVDRTLSGRRKYASDHVAWVEFLNILKATGMGVVDMARYVSLRSEGAKTIALRQQMLAKHLKVVLTRRQELERAERLLNEKISLFQSVIDGELDENSLSCTRKDIKS